MKGIILAGGSGTTTATPVPNAPAVNYAQPNNYGPPASSLGGLPQRPVRTDGGLGISAGGGQPYNPQPVTTPAMSAPLSREEAEARIEAQRRMLEEKGSSAARLLPPTSLGRSLNLPPAPGK